MCPTGLVYDAFPQYINELNIYVGFTAMCFIYFTKKHSRTVFEDPVDLQFAIRKGFSILSLLFAIAAVYDFIRLGAHFDVSAARDMAHEIQGSQSTLVGYAKTLAMPLSVMAGYMLCIAIVEHKKIGIIIFLPLLGNLIFSLNVGGRVDAFYSFLMYLMGFSFALPIKFDIHAYKKVLIIGAVGIVLFCGFINFVGRQRAVGHHNTISATEAYLDNVSPLLGAIYGPIEYSMASWTGYQERRYDAYDENHKGWGKYTFNGFINWTLPFSSQLGFGDFSIAKALNLYYSNMETYDETRQFYYVTHSCYFLLIKDYGFWGVFIAIILLTAISQKLFIKVQSKSVLKYASSLYLYYLIWLYWSHSMFGETLSRSVLLPLYGFLMVDIVNYLLKGHSR